MLPASGSLPPPPTCSSQTIEGPVRCKVGLPAVGSLLTLPDMDQEKMAQPDATSECLPLVAACSPYLIKQTTEAQPEHSCVACLWQCQG